MKSHEKPWGNLNQEEVNRFFPIIAKLAERYGDMAHSSRWEFAKYLFTANTGAAAGLFLARSAGDPNYLFPFFLFCLGTFCVGLAYFMFSSWAHSFAEDFASDAISGISVEELDANARKRWQSWRFTGARYCLVCSFAFLIIGGIISAKLFWSPASRPRTIVPTASIRSLAH